MSEKLSLTGSVRVDEDSGSAFIEDGELGDGVVFESISLAKLLLGRFSHQYNDTTGCHNLDRKVKITLEALND